MQPKRKLTPRPGRLPMEIRMPHVALQNGTNRAVTLRVVLRIVRKDDHAVGRGTGAHLLEGPRQQAPELGVRAGTLAKERFS